MYLVLSFASLGQDISDARLLKYQEDKRCDFTQATILNVILLSNNDGKKVSYSFFALLKDNIWVNIIIIIIIIYL